MTLPLSVQQTYESIHSVRFDLSSREGLRRFVAMRSILQQQCLCRKDQRGPHSGPTNDAGGDGSKGAADVKPDEQAGALW